MNFKVGQKVVCINDTHYTKRTTPGETYPRKGHVYTIREIVREHLRFEEIRNPIQKYLDWDRLTPTLNELCFHHWRFRPVKTTSLDVFNKILKDVDSRIDHKETV